MAATQIEETVMQRALRTIDRGPDDVIDLLKLGNSDPVHQLARHLAEFEGVVLVGHPSLVEDAIDRRVPIVEQEFRDWHTSICPPRKGRPESDRIADLIQTAALYKFWGGVSKTKAAGLAANYLGSPATKYSVEKAFRRFWRDMNVLAVVVRNLNRPSSQVTDMAVRLVSSIQRDLDAIAENLQREEAEAEASRKTARHTPFFGASTPLKITLHEKETTGETEGKI